MEAIKPNDTLLIEQTLIKPEALSADGYITDQDVITNLPYRTMTTNINGCGWIAAYNMRRALGSNVFFDDVRIEMDKMHRLRIPGPTTMKVMRDYLGKYLLDYTESHGKTDAVKSAKQAKAGIFRYNEEGVPHFICFVHSAGNDFRFFNVNDEIGDKIIDMDRFASEHFRIGCVVALTVPEKA